ncbi:MULTISPECIES: hypothetical protein [Nocardioides]|uniref:Uncharacterized protein n=1 Tax=Nocardioides vastitatis TaxID=2568655 RepID=A0ABW0ZE37_9ACTN|nr:hypothetical protein [Nocardioides sp.]THI95309.1 hypothetical protein E7Z54_19445 [Nocardioides sp.]
MGLRRRAAAAIGLVSLLPLLAGCGDDAAALEVGDVVPAREDDQFAAGAASFLEIPLGRLEVSLGEPSASLSDRDTSEFAAMRAPEGSTFVPITWQYDAGTFGAFAEYVGDDAPSPVIDLVSDGARYRLPPPAESGEGSESFYVLVTGAAEEVALSVEYDGVVQTLDLVTGEREEGAAAGLYRARKAKRGTRSCKEAATFDATQGFPTYRCEISRTIRLPYADGAWAEPGRAWLVMTLTTGMRRFDVYGPLPGSGALYGAESVRANFRIGERKPVAVLRDPDALCPDIARGGCTATYHLVFDGRAAAGAPLVIEQRFALALGTQWGSVDRKATMKFGVHVEAPLR